MAGKSVEDARLTERADASPRSEAVRAADLQSDVLRSVLAVANDALRVGQPVNEDTTHFAPRQSGATLLDIARRPEEVTSEVQGKMIARMLDSTTPMQNWIAAVADVLRKRLGINPLESTKDASTSPPIANEDLARYGNATQTFERNAVTPGRSLAKAVVLWIKRYFGSLTDDDLRALERAQQEVEIATPEVDELYAELARFYYRGLDHMLVDRAIQADLHRHIDPEKLRGFVDAGEEASLTLGPGRVHLTRLLSQVNLAGESMLMSAIAEFEKVAPGLRRVMAQLARQLGRDLATDYDEKWEAEQAIRAKNGE